MPTPIARASIATPRATIAQLDMPRPNSITKTAMVPTTAATSLRAGAIGRPFWFATVDLPGYQSGYVAVPARERAVAARPSGGTDRLTSRCDNTGAPP
ncbi:hypothetical protein ACFQFC_17225 [Amorphoplanes digitatis]|uniref:Uncharacterized protein n=1 Tax=Actinoplanes digitatis TaxID=1868 RepID=A0A7W7I3V7_9ACTN|nr:hypothetical protein [Actinoplanes digitatis]MBB4765957.1 hypothetical protein [Actinoplanes digitatis]